MSGLFPPSEWRLLVSGLVALLMVCGPARAQQRTSASSAADQSKNGGTVVRTFGTQGGYRTEVKSQTIGKLSEEDRRQASLLMAEVFQHLAKARDAVDADDTKRALKEVNKAREAVRAIRAILPKGTIHVRTTGPDGKVIFEDDEEIRVGRIPLFEGMLHTQTLAPILAARRNAMEVAGVQVVESERVATEVIANLDPIESQLERAVKALEQNKPEDASKALAMALVRGLEFRFNKEDTELASARDEIWLARRSIEENNPVQALANLAAARQRLKVYRELLPQDQRQEVDQMLSEIDQLEAQLRQEGSGAPVSSDLRTHQGNTVTHWWDRINSWFRRHI